MFRRWIPALLLSLSVQPWAFRTVLLNLSFLIYKMGLIKASSEGVNKDQMLTKRIHVRLSHNVGLCYYKKYSNPGVFYK